jgi:hypothetical protein
MKKLLAGAATFALILFLGGCGDQSPLGVGNNGVTGDLSSAQPLVVGGVQDMATGGVGLEDQDPPPSFDVVVPAGVDIVSAVFYWNGRARDDDTGDNTIIINDVEYTADSEVKFRPGINTFYSFFYKLDAIAAGISVGPGTNTYTVHGFDLPGNPDSRNSGIGLAVIYNDPSASPPNNHIETKELTEFYYWGTPGYETGDVHNFMFDPAGSDRTGKMTIMVGDTSPDRISRIWYDASSGDSPPGDLVGGAYPYVEDVLTAANGLRWDVYTMDVTVPAGAGHFAFQMESPDSGINGESGQLSFASFEVPEECTGMIGDFVWMDQSGGGAGLQDPGEPGIGGVELNLYDGGGSLIGTTTTDSDGYYEFTGLCAGDYTVEVNGSTLPADVQPAPCQVGSDETIDNNCSPADVTLPADDTEDVTIDFGYEEIPQGGGEGCTPGYWRQPQHFFAWTAPYQTDTPFESVFGRDVPGDPTLLEAVDNPGGQLNQLMFHATAALLNAASPDVDFSYTVDEVISLFQQGFDSYMNDDHYDSSYKDMLADANESDCPLGNDPDGSDDHGRGGYAHD